MGELAFYGERPEIAVSHLELALKHYEIALSMMNDEETKTNAKFYEDYKQRDFRSGKIVLKTDYLVEYIEEKIKKNKGSE